MAKSKAQTHQGGGDAMKVNVLYIPITPAP